MERGIKPRRNLLFRTGLSLSLAGISFLGVTLTLLIVIMMFPYVSEPETGIFIGWDPSLQEAREGLEDYVVLRVALRKGIRRPSFLYERLSNLTLVLDGEPIRFEQLESHLERAWKEYPSEPEGSFTYKWIDESGREQATFVEELWIGGDSNRVEKRITVTTKDTSGAEYMRRWFSKSWDIDVVLVIESEALPYLSHGDFIAICDMFKMHDFYRIIVTTG